MPGRITSKATSQMSMFKGYEGIEYVCHGKKFKGYEGIEYVQRLWGEGVCLFVGKVDRGGKYSRATVLPT